MNTRRKVSLDHDRRRTRWKVQWGVPARAAGGTARAAALSGDERREIARKAAKARWARHLPRATHQGVLRLDDIEIEVAILDNGQRVITQDGLMWGLGRIRPPKGRPYRRSSNLPAFLAMRNLKPFIGEGLVVLANQIEFRTEQGLKTVGYAASFLPEVCAVFARAQQAGVLNVTQRNIAHRAEIIAEQLQRSSMTCLIARATGYRESREMRDAPDGFGHED